MWKEILGKKFIFGLMMLLMVLSVTGASMGITVSFQEGATNAYYLGGYDGTHDDWFYGHPSYPVWWTYNHGATQTMPVHSDPSNSILKFTGLGVLAGKYISIDSATISLRQTASVPANPNFDIEFLQIADNNADWLEGTGVAWNYVAQAGEPSWNDRASPTDWNGGGGAVGGATSLGTLSVSPTNPQYTTYVFSLPTTLVEQWITGGVNAGVVMKMADATISNMAFYASESTLHPTLGNLRPKLTITYTAAPTPAASLSQYEPDENTLALFHFDEGHRFVTDVSHADPAYNKDETVEEAQDNIDWDMTPGILGGTIGSLEYGAPGAIYGAIGNQNLSNPGDLKAIYLRPEYNSISEMNIDAWTVEFWWKPVTGSPSVQHLVARDGGGTGARSWILQANHSINSFQMTWYTAPNGSSSDWFAAPENIITALDQWYHIAITYDDVPADPNIAIAEMYFTPAGDTTANLVHSQVISPIARPTASTSRLTALHNYNGRWGRECPGLIDELRFSDKIRTAEEFTTLLPPATTPSYRTTGSLSAETRRIVEEVWDNRKQDLADYIDYDFVTNDSAASMYFIESYTIALLRYAIWAEDDVLLDELCALYLKPYVYYDTDRWNTVEKGGDEERLWSSQFLYPVMVAINGILDIPSGDRTTNMNNMITTYVPVVRDDHADRWIRGTAVFTSPWPGDCDGALPVADHHERLTNLLNKSYQTTYTYCNAVIDTDMWIIAMTAELLKANNKDATLVPISAGLKTDLLSYMTTASDLLEDRMTASSLTTLDRVTPAAGLNFDAGAWTDHPAYKYAGYGGSIEPVPADANSVVKKKMVF